MESNQVITRDSPLARGQGVYDALVLDARLRQSLTTVRSLGSRGLRVAALETFAGVPVFSSRWCQQAFVCPADVGTKDSLTYLEEVLDCPGARVLITSSECEGSGVCAFCPVDQVESTLQAASHACSTALHTVSNKNKLIITPTIPTF